MPPWRNLVAVLSMQKFGLKWYITWPRVVPDMEHLHEQQLAGRSTHATEGCQKQPLHSSVKDGPVCSCARCQDGSYLTVRQACTAPAPLVTTQSSYVSYMRGRAKSGPAKPK